MTIANNYQPVDLLYENEEPVTDDEKKLNLVDLSKVDTEVRYQEPHIDKEQFVLLGMSPKENLVNDIKMVLTDFQRKLRGFINDAWDLMEDDPNGDSVNYADLAELMSITERAKRNISISDKVRRKSY